MEQSERRKWLINRLKGESKEYESIKIPESDVKQKEVLRSLMNIRPPQKNEEEFLLVQNEYLKEEIKTAGIVEVSEIPSCTSDPRLAIWQGDITRLAADAIVNAANSQMLGCFQPMHACIDNCIHTFAGVQLREECARQMDALRKVNGEGYEQPTAVPMITQGYNLPAKHVIHIVGPIVMGSLTGEHEEKLAGCYSSTLDICRDNGLKNVAFCCISTGVFHFPAERAAEIAVGTVTEWLDANEHVLDKVIFNVFGDKDRQIYEALLC